MFSRITLKIVALMCTLFIVGSLALSSCALLELFKNDVNSDVQTDTDTDVDSGNNDNTDTDEDNKDTPHSHTVVTDEAIQPTCTEAGATQGKHCSTCGEIILEATTVPASGHS